MHTDKVLGYHKSGLPFDALGTEQNGRQCADIFKSIFVKKIFGSNFHFYLFMRVSHFDNTSKQATGHYLNQ